MKNAARSLILLLLSGITLSASDSVVVFNEVMFHPLSGAREEEWIELHNQMTVDVDLSDWEISGGVYYRIPSGTILEGGGYLVIARDPATIPNALGPFEGKLDRGGDLLELRTPTQRLMNRLAFDDEAPWPVAADGSGATLAKLDPQSGSDEPHWWNASLEIGGTPGAPNRFPQYLAPEPTLRFHEVPSIDDGLTWVEVWNHSSAPIDPADYQIHFSSHNETLDLHQGNLSPKQAVQVSLPALDPPLESGDRLFLINDQKVIDAVRIKNTRNQARLESNPRRWHVPTELSPGKPNLVEFEEDIIINEIHYHHPPQYADPGEFGDAITIPFSTEWRYYEEGPLSPGWASESHEDWPEGPGVLGFSRDEEDLPLPIGTRLTAGPITYYFELDFDPGFTGQSVELQWTQLLDDGAVFYLNGVEFSRQNLPDGTITADTVATTTVNQLDISPLQSLTLSPDLLLPGSNRLSVEVHQSSILSSDLLFGMEISLPEVIRPRREFAERDEEWIEIYNRGSEPVDLSGWELSDGVRFTFPEGTNLAPDSYLLIAEDEDALREKYPDINIVGQWRGSLSNSGERLLLEESRGNPADEIRYYDGGRWPRYADGGGSTLELLDPFADNSHPEAWAPSDESDKVPWKEYRFRDTVSRSPVGPDNQWKEFVLGLQDDGEILIDDIQLTQDPDGEARVYIRNSSFKTSIFGGGPLREWRMLGTHRHSTSVPDPDEDGNLVLNLRASGATGHMHNHIETTLANRQSPPNGAEVEVTFRARWKTGNPLLNTRLYFNRLARTTVLEIPESIGTPGRPNSRLLDNLGPTFSDLHHDPPVPDPGMPVEVSVLATDPQQVSSVTLFWGVDGANW
ncbi:MAG: lamin tail domain-containing protein, partial [Verrucomicrobiota bacterium]